MSSAQAPRSRRSTLISHPTLLGERWMPSPRWEHLQGHCLAETLSFVNPALVTGRYHHCGRPRQAARATYRLRAHALLRRDGPCARWIIGPGKGLRGLVDETSVLRASVSSTTLTVSSIEELNTRSMSLHTRPCDLKPYWSPMTHTCQTQFHLERCQRADTFGRARRWGCGAVYEPALIPYRAQNIAHPTREESGPDTSCSPTVSH